MVYFPYYMFDRMLKDVDSGMFDQKQIEKAKKKKARNKSQKRKRSKK